MFKSCFRLICFALLLLLLSFNENLAQENLKQESSKTVSYVETIVVRFKDDKGVAYQEMSVVLDRKKPLVDLSAQVREKCNKTLSEKVGQSFVEVRFSEEASAEAAEILRALRSVVEISAQTLFPLSVRGVRVFLLPIDSSIENYKIRVPEEKDLYQTIKLYKSKDELKLSCEKATPFCQEIFGTIPHELAHLAFEGLTEAEIEDDKVYPRWFEEGVAEYNATQCATKLMPSVKDYRLDTTLPKVSLSRPEVRRKLFDWRRFEKGKSHPITKFEWLPKNPSPESYTWNQSTLYGASRQLIELIINEAKKQGIENPLALLFQEMQNAYKQKNKLLSDGDVLQLIREKLKVEPTRLGDISLSEQQQMVKQELEFLRQNIIEGEPKRNNVKKYKALSVVASLDVGISEAEMEMLLRIAYDERQDGMFRGLAATALARRANRVEFERLVEKMIASDARFKKKSVKSVRKELEKLSFRPRLES